MDVNLLDYFMTKAKNNEANRIQAPATKLGGPKVGSGKYMKRTKQDVDFQGELTSFMPGPFSFSLKILDDERCSLTLNGKNQTGSYKKDGKKLQIETGDDRFLFYAGGKGTYIDGIPGLKPLSAWIGK